MPESIMRATLRPPGGLCRRHHNRAQGARGLQLETPLITVTVSGKVQQNIEREGNVPAALRASLPAVRDFTGLNFLLSDGKTLYAFRDASKRHEYYSLYFLVRDPLDGQLERFESTEVGTLLHSKSLRGEKAVLVCSERLTSEDWKPLELGHLLTIPESLIPVSDQIR